jgi:hypothetical protein
MQTAAGGHYRVGLALNAAESVGPAWLPAALTATYPQSDLSEVEYYDGKHSVVVLRWRSGAGTISEGDRVIAAAQGIELPSGLFPSASVMAVEQVERAPSERDIVGGAFETVGIEYGQELKIAGAAALLIAVVYFSGRIRRKHVDTGGAELAAYRKTAA